MEEINKRIVFQRAVPDVDNPVGRERACKFYEQYYEDCVGRLNKFKMYLSETEARNVERGVSAAEMESWRYSTTNEHIQLLEAVVRAKRNMEWMDRGLHELLADKIKLLESMI